MQVFATWLWAYVTYDRAVRVLTPDSLQSDIQVAPSAQARVEDALCDRNH